MIILYSLVVSVHYLLSSGSGMEVVSMSINLALQLIAGARILKAFWSRLAISVIIEKLIYKYGFILLVSCYTVKINLKVSVD